MRELRKWTLAAKTIQCAYRGKKARQVFQQLLIERKQRLRIAALKLSSQKRELAVRLIQIHFRRHLNRVLESERRRAFALKRRELERTSFFALENSSAMKIQLMYRQRIIWFTVYAVRLQRFAKHYLFATHFRNLVHDVTELHTTTIMAIRIQCCFRTRKAGRRVAILRAEKQMRIEAAAAVEEENRIEIQRQATCWVEFWDDENQQAYYYNEETGESSWEKPGIVLKAEAMEAEALEAAMSAQEFPEEASAWEEYYDDSTTQTYYYNTLTGMSSWNQPTKNTHHSLMDTMASAYQFQAVPEDQNYQYADEYVDSYVDENQYYGEAVYQYDENSDVYDETNPTYYEQERTYENGEYTQEDYYSVYVDEFVEEEARRSVPL